MASKNTNKKMFDSEQEEDSEPSNRNDGTLRELMKDNPANIITTKHS